MPGVCIDPGHQASADLRLEPIGPNTELLKPACAKGTTGSTSGVPEHEVVLKIALEIERVLSKAGLSVLLTRRHPHESISNRERAEFANRSGAELCVKLHCNGVRDRLRWLGRFKRGAETLVPARGAAVADIHDASLTAARVLHPHVLRATGFPDRGITERSDLSGFNWSAIPVVLLELGYLTHPLEEELLISAQFQTRLAEGISAGIIEALHAV